MSGERVNSRRRVERGRGTHEHEQLKRRVVAQSEVTTLLLNSLSVLVLLLEGWCPGTRDRN
jgi:hypothetical protein